jgi:hypothetical protein
MLRKDVLHEDIKYLLNTLLWLEVEILDLYHPSSQVEIF